MATYAITYNLDKREIIACSPEPNPPAPLCGTPPPFGCWSPPRWEAFSVPPPVRQPAPRKAPPSPQVEATLQLSIVHPRDPGRAARTTLTIAEQQHLLRRVSERMHLGDTCIGRACGVCNTSAKKWRLGKTHMSLHAETILRALLGKKL